jgi:sulfatase maturation enzyme AslB (radical SAM superfamily)
MSKYCPLPFIHISSTNDGNYRVCCYSEESAITKEDGSSYNMRTDSIIDVWNSKFYQNLRNDLLAGIENSTCNTCWKHEQNNTYSKRQQSLQEYKGMYIEGYTEPVPKFLDVKVGTLCNLKCITCYPGASSMHQDEVNNWRKNGIKVPALIDAFEDRLNRLNINIEQSNPKNVDIEKVIENLEPSLKTATQLSLVGGEPLVNPIAQRIIEYCVEKNYSKQMMLSIITNLTTLNPKMLDYLNKFKHPIIMVSYDHIDNNKFNYIRFPANYEHFSKNLESLFKNSNIEIKLSTTWSIFNIYDITKIFDYWETLSQRYKKRFIINFQFVMYPNYFNIQYLSQDKKNYIANLLHNYLGKNINYKIFQENPDMLSLVKSISNYMYTTVDNFEDVVKERDRVLNLYDQTRGTNHSILFPEVFD